MRMKKLLALAMSAVMVLGILTGCGSSKSSSSGKADSIANGIILAKEAIDSGKAAEVLENLVNYTK